MEKARTPTLDDIRIKWFGRYHTSKVCGMLFMAALASIPFYLGHPTLLYKALVCLGFAILVVDGVTIVSPRQGQIQRTVRLLWVLPCWRKTVALRAHGELCLKYQRPWRGQYNRHYGDNTTLVLRHGPRDWIQLAQADNCGGDFHGPMLTSARQCAAAMRIPLIEEIESTTRDGIRTVTRREHTEHDSLPD